MVQLVHAGQFDLVPKISNLGAGIGQGMQMANQFQAGKQKRLEAEQAKAQQGYANEALQGNKEAYNNLNIDMKKKVSDMIATQTEAETAEQKRENEVLTRGAMDALLLKDPVKIRQFIGQQSEKFKAEGRDTSRTDSLLSMNDEQMMQALDRQARMGQELNVLYEQQFGVGKPTSLMQNLEAAGYVKGTPAYKEQLKMALQKTGTTVNIGGGDGKFMEEVAKGQAKAYSEIGAKADAAIDANQAMDLIEGLDIGSGGLEPAKQALASFGNAFGFDTSSIANISAGEGFNSVAAKMVLQAKASQKGPQTDKDEATIRQSVIQLGNTAEGNAFIMDSARALNNRMIERKEFYDAKIEENGGKFRGANGKTVDAEWSKFKRDTPMVSKNLKTPQGIPVFFYKFENEIRKKYPDITKTELLELWRKADKKKVSK